MTDTHKRKTMAIIKIIVIIIIIGRKRKETKEKNTKKRMKRRRSRKRRRERINICCSYTVLRCYDLFIPASSMEKIESQNRPPQ